jgi:hypothetical protein
VDEADKEECESDEDEPPFDAEDVDAEEEAWNDEEEESWEDPPRDKKIVHPHGRKPHGGKWKARRA